MVCMAIFVFFTGYGVTLQILDSLREHYWFEEITCTFFSFVLVLIFHFLHKCDDINPLA
jgi:hypothetical protein